MSNIRDGGDIIIGMERQSDDTYLPRGMEPEHLDSYSYDNIGRAVAEYADPYTRFVLMKEEDHLGKKYVWIRVYEFEETPIICRKPSSNILSGGKIYTRTRRIPESAEVPSSAEMREILNMATEKKLREFHQLANAASLEFQRTVTPTDEQAFEEQLGGLF